MNQKNSCLLRSDRTYIMSTVIVCFTKLAVMDKIYLCRERMNLFFLMLLVSYFSSSVATCRLYKKKHVEFGFASGKLSHTSGIVQLSNASKMFSVSRIPLCLQYRMNNIGDKKNSVNLKYYSVLASGMCVVLYVDIWCTELNDLMGVKW